MPDPIEILRNKLNMTNDASDMLIMEEAAKEIDLLRRIDTAHRDHLDAAEKEIEGLSKKLANAQTGFKKQSKYTEELEKKLQDTNDKINVTSTRCINVEGQLQELTTTNIKLIDILHKVTKGN